MDLLVKLVEYKRCVEQTCTLFVVVLGVIHIASITSRIHTCTI